MTEPNICYICETLITPANACRKPACQSMSSHHTFCDQYKCHLCGGLCNDKEKCNYAGCEGLLHHVGYCHDTVREKNKKADEQAKKKELREAKEREAKEKEAAEHEEVAKKANELRMKEAEAVEGLLKSSVSLNERTNQSDINAGPPPIVSNSNICFHCHQLVAEADRDTRPQFAAFPPHHVHCMTEE